MDAALWGGYPGDDVFKRNGGEGEYPHAAAPWLDRDMVSGVGWTRNSYMIKNGLKTVCRSPFVHKYHIGSKENSSKMGLSREFALNAAEFQTAPSAGTFLNMIMPNLCCCLAAPPRASMSQIPSKIYERTNTLPRKIISTCGMVAMVVAPVILAYSVYAFVGN